MNPDNVPPWGCPWHGLISGGQLELADGGKIPFPNPISGIGQTIMGYGATLYQRMPWAQQPPKINPNPIPGAVWADYAILCGSRQSLHGRPIDGWIYAAPDGQPWLITPADGRYYLSWPASADPWSAEMTAVQFGRLGGSAERRPFTLELLGTGQGSPALSMTPSVQVTDITPDGAQAILTVFVGGHGFTQYSRHTIWGIPVGFWLLTLSGTPGVDFSASLTVLRNRAEVLGTLVDTGPLPGVEMEYPTYGAGDEPLSDNHPLYTRRQYYSDTGPAQYTSYQGERAADISRIVDMWFDTDGVAQPVILDVGLRIECDTGEIESTAEGEIIYTRHDGTGEIVSSSGHLAERRYFEYSASEQLTLTLRYKDLSISETMSLEESGSWEYNGYKEFGVPWETTVSTVNTRSITTARGTASATTENKDTDPSWMINFTANPRLWGIPAADNGDQLISLFDASTTFSLGIGTIYPEGGSYSASIGMMRYSNNLYALTVSEIDDFNPQLGPLGQLVTTHAGNCLTPRGVVSGSVTSYPVPDDYGSWNPATGQTVRGAHAPVCWT